MKALGPPDPFVILRQAESLTDFPALSFWDQPPYFFEVGWMVKRGYPLLQLLEFVPGSFRVPASPATAIGQGTAVQGSGGLGDSQGGSGTNKIEFRN